jgi:hypothetical protein
MPCCIRAEHSSQRYFAVRLCLTVLMKYPEAERPQILHFTSFVGAYPPPGTLLLQRLHDVGQACLTLSADRSKEVQRHCTSTRGHP